MDHYIYVELNEAWHWTLPHGVICSFDRTQWKLATSSVLAPSSDALVPSCFLFLVVRPGATSSVL